MCATDNYESRDGPTPQCEVPTLNRKRPWAMALSAHFATLILMDTAATDKKTHPETHQETPEVVTWTSISRFLVANTVFFGCKPGCLHLPFLNAFCMINVRENYAKLKTNSRNLSREDESVKTKCKKYLMFVWHLFHKVYVEHEPIVRDFPIAKCKVGLWKRDFHETSFKTDAFGAWNDISSRIFMRKQWHEIVDSCQLCARCLRCSPLFPVRLNFSHLPT